MLLICLQVACSLLVLVSSTFATVITADVERAPILPPRTTQEMRILVDESVSETEPPLANAYRRGGKKVSTTRAAGTPRLTLVSPDEKLRAVASSAVEFTDDAIIDGHNGLETAVRLAYSGHHPLRLRPDDLWMPIVLSIAAHVEERAEAFRADFVSFEGTTQLNINVAPSYLDDGEIWADVVHTIVSLIRANTRSDVAAAFEPSFSTTDSVSRAASGIAVMSAMKHYFTYGVTLGCGLREVVLEGVPADWDALRTRAANLATLAGGRVGLELSDWFSRLDGTLFAIAETAHGRPDATFWSRIYSSKSYGSGGQVDISGWLLHFFLYDIGGNRVQGSLRAHSVPYLHASVDVQMGNRDFRFTSGSWAVGFTEKEITPIIEWLVTEIVIKEATVTPPPGRRVNVRAL